MEGLEAWGAGLIVRVGFIDPIGGPTARGASKLVCSMLGFQAISVGDFLSKLFLPKTSTLSRLVATEDFTPSKGRLIIGGFAGPMLVRRCSPPALVLGRSPSILDLLDSVFVVSMLVFCADNSRVDS